MWKAAHIHDTVVIGRQQSRGLQVRGAPEHGLTTFKFSAEHAFDRSIVRRSGANGPSRSKLVHVSVSDAKSAKNEKKSTNRQEPLEKG